MEININYLRLSVTDRCNLNCLYCTPIEKDKFMSHSQVLRYEEMARLVSLFVKTGIKKVRITGGEPLIKKDIIELVKMIKNIPGLEELSLTTNGVYLKQFASQLKTAGINQINISIDTLKRERFKYITGYDFFNAVWKGIKEALLRDFSSVKLNVIPLKGINEDEIFDFVKLTVKYPLAVRFIEIFPTNARSIKLAGSLIENNKIKEEIKKRFPKMIEDTRNPAAIAGPAQYYRIPNAQGLIGFISSSTGHFCNACNRIRVNCAGEISPCLFSGYRYNITSLLKTNAPDEKIIESIKKAIASKPEYTKEIISERKIEMSSVGG